VGDKLSSCLTPQVTSNQSVNMLFHFKHDVAFVYIRVIILYSFQSMSLHNNLYHNKVLSIQSNAFAMSIRATNVDMLSFILILTKLVRVKICSSHDRITNWRIFHNCMCCWNDIINSLCHAVLILFIVCIHACAVEATHIKHQHWCDKQIYIWKKRYNETQIYCYNCK
jgi:hypothetical protein